MFCKFFLQLKEKLTGCQLKFNEFSDFNQKFADLFGPSLHTRHSESYFCSAMYNTLNDQSILNLTPDGKITNLYENQQQTTGKWLCNDSICMLNKPILLNRFISFIQTYNNLKPFDIEQFMDNIDVCTNSIDGIVISSKKIFCKCGENNCVHTCFEDIRTLKSGHQPYCYEKEDKCSSVLLFLRRISAHFPFIRQTVRLIYSIRHEFEKIRNLKNILLGGNLTELQEISAEINFKSNGFLVESFSFNEESQIYDTYKNAFDALRRVNGQFIHAFHVINYAL